MLVLLLFSSANLSAYPLDRYISSSSYTDHSRFSDSTADRDLRIPEGNLAPDLSSSNVSQGTQGEIITETVIDYVQPGPEGYTALADDCGDGTNQYALEDGAHWASFPVSYAVDPANSGVDPTSATNAVIASFNEFEKYMPGSSFTLTSNFNGADIKVRWQFIDGPFGQVGQATFSYTLPDRELISSTITLDSGDSWFVSNVERCTGSGSFIDIETVSSHELGHSVGIDHVSDPLQTMYPSITAGETFQRSLGNGDRAGLTQLYFDWSNYQSLGGNLKSNPFVAVNSDGRLDAFVVASNNGLYHRWQNSPGSSSWSGWTSLGGNLKGDPFAEVNLDGRLEAFAVASNNALYHRWQTSPGSSTWSGWTSLGGNLISNPFVAVNSDGRLEAFAVASNNALYHRWQVTPPFL